MKKSPSAFRHRMAPHRSCAFLSLAPFVMADIGHSIAAKGTIAPSGHPKPQPGITPFHPFFLIYIPFLPKQSP